MSSKTEAAWAAGFFDGEGYVGFGVTKEGYRIVRLSISQLDAEVLYRFKRAVECGTVYGPYDKGREKPIYMYNVGTAKEVTAIYDIIGPYLSGIKCEAFEKAISAYEGFYDDKELAVYDLP